MIKVFGDARIVKAEVVSVKDNRAELREVVLVPTELKAELNGTRNDCICYSSLPTLIIPTLNIDVRDTSLQLPYPIIQDIRRMKDAHTSR